MNYRITTDVPSQAVFDYAKSDYSYLLKKDQLMVTQRAGFAFKDFIEPSVTFPPTYKYLRFSNEYDQRPGKKIRAPAWCDRILYYMRDPPQDMQTSTVRVTEYDHVRSYGSSDHKPVYARAVLLVKQYDLKKFEALCQQALKKLQCGENAQIPKILISETEVAFGELTYASRRNHMIRIINVGDVNVYFRFLPRDASNRISSPFMKIQPVFGVIPPGETQSISIEMDLDLNAEHQLENAQGILDDMIAFRVNNDRDYYIHFTGRCLPTSFGQSLASLVRRMRPGEGIQYD